MDTGYQRVTDNHEPVQVQADLPTTVSVEEDYEVNELIPHPSGGDECDDNDQRGSATITSSVFNLSNTILGSGVLAMPNACSESGVIGFVLLTLLSATMADRAVFMLFDTIRHCEMGDKKRIAYADLGTRTTGKVGMLVASWSVTLQQFGACIAYVVIIGDVIQPVVVEMFPACTVWCERWFIQVFVIVFVIFPLCLLRHMDSLKYTSIAALVFIMAFVTTVVANGVLVLADPDRRWQLEGVSLGAVDDVVAVNVSDVAPGNVTRNTDVHWWPQNTHVFSSLSVFAFAFLCHQNTFPIYNELKEPSVENMSKISLYSMVSCASTYLLVGVFGYLTFLDRIKPDIFKNFVQGSYISEWMNFIRIGFGISLVFSYPVVVWEARSNIDLLVFGERPYNFYRYLVLNIAIISITGVIGVTASDIEQVLGLVGATCSPMMMFILPPLFHIKSGCAAATGRWYSSIAMLIVGILLVPFGVTVWFTSEVLHK